MDILDSTLHELFNYYTKLPFNPFYEQERSWYPYLLISKLAIFYKN